MIRPGSQPSFSTVTARRFPPPWSVEEHAPTGMRLSSSLGTRRTFGLGGIYRVLCFQHLKQIKCDTKGSYSTESKKAAL